MAQYDALFEPLRIKNLTIRNRFLSTSHSPAYARGGEITDRYVRYHAEKAKGGVGLTLSSAARPRSRRKTPPITGRSTVPMTGSSKATGRWRAAVHEQGAACTVQLTHGGRRERWDIAGWLPTFSSSCRREVVHGSFPVIMEDHDIARTVRNYASAARRVREGDVDGVEISCQAGTLIEQFWSPAMNFRTDGYGGSLENRMRFGLETLEAVRTSVGDDYVVGIRMPGDEMMDGGLSQDDCTEIARAYAASGLIDFISVVGGAGLDLQGRGHDLADHVGAVGGLPEIRQGDPGRGVDRHLPRDPDHRRGDGRLRGQGRLSRYGRHDPGAYRRPRTMSTSCARAGKRRSGLASARAIASTG